MNAAKRILKLLNALVDLVVILALLLAGTYSVYALADERRVYTAAENVREELLKLKPETEEGSGESFARLREINADVCAWLTLEGTRIDYPVVQGSDNLCYLNTDVYGKFALAGSIFLDARNDRAFSDTCSLLYGHHMDQRRMFGDLDRYKEAAFFSEHAAGLLILPEQSYRLEIFACLVVPASEKTIFEPRDTTVEALLALTESCALQRRAELIESIRACGDAQVLAMSTCSAEFTDARTVVLARMEPCDA